MPRESTAPPPPDDRPYDDKLMRLAEILGAIHYLRELCGATEGQVWREQMKEILRNEGTTAVRRAKLVNAFNDGYRGYRRSYRTCTQSATLATNRFSTEGATIAAALAQNSTFASKGPAEGTPKPRRGPIKARLRPGRGRRPRPPTRKRAARRRTQSDGSQEPTCCPRGTRARPPDCLTAASRIARPASQPEPPDSTRRMSRTLCQTAQSRGARSRARDTWT